MNIVLLEKMGISNSQIDIFKKKIENWGHDFIVYENRDENPTVLIERSKNADILILSNIPFSAEIIDKCSKLKMISVGFTGVDHINMESLNRREF